MELNIQFKQIDPDAKAASTPTATDKQPWIDITELSRDDVEPLNAMTLEHNQAILDGTMDEFPVNPQAYDWGLITLSQSDENGLFAVPPTIDVTFSGLRSSLGISLFFYPYSQDWASSVRVTWYATNLTTVIKTGVYALTNTLGVVQEPISNYRRVTIELLATNIPFRYVKIYDIEYGVIFQIKNNQLDAANLLEEIDPVSDVLSINTFGFGTKTHESLYSPISGNVGDNMFMKRQVLTVSSGLKPFGTFFLDTWKDRHNTGTCFDFKTIDAIGVMGGYRFMGDIYANALVSDVLQQIFDLCFPTGLVKFRLDDDFTEARITGHIPACTGREALQYICFALGAVADTSRRNHVWIYKRDTEKTFDIPRNKIYQGGDNEPTEYFSGLDLMAYEFKPTTEMQEIHNDTLPIGQHTFEFSEPLHNITVTGATIVAKSANYAVLNVSAAGTVVLRGNTYRQVERVHSIRTEVIAGQQGNICEFSGMTLVDNNKAPALAASLWAYISQRIMINNEVRLEDLEVGYIAEVATYQLPVLGTIEKLDTNLLGGRSKMKVVGDVNQLD